MNRILADQSQLLFIDLQDRLVRSLPGDVRTQIKQKIVRIERIARRLGIPCHYTELEPRSFGHSMPSLSAQHPFERTCLTAVAHPELAHKPAHVERHQILLMGLETHIAVSQTALDLLSLGYQVYVLADGCFAADPEEHAIALELLRQQGVRITTLRATLFSWVDDVHHPMFHDLKRELLHR